LSWERRRLEEEEEEEGEQHACKGPFLVDFAVCLFEEAKEVLELVNFSRRRFYVGEACCGSHLKKRDSACFKSVFL
jgi:hypothetical protein